MNLLSRDKQIEVIAALTEGVGIRATARLTGVNRETVGKLDRQGGKGCAEVQDRRRVGGRVARIELDEVWSFVGKKEKRVKRHEAFAKGDQYVFTALASTQKAIISYRIGKRDGANTDDFVQDLRGRVLGAPEISTDGLAILYAVGPRRLPQQRSRGHRKDVGGNRSPQRRSAPLQSVRSSSSKPRGGSRRPVRNLNLLCPTIELNPSHGVASLTPLNERLQQEA